MVDRQTASDQCVDDPDHAARFVLACLIGHHPALLSIDELFREFAGSDGDPGEASVVVDDGLAELVRSGLAHRLDRFVFASQAAVRASRLGE